MDHAGSQLPWSEEQWTKVQSAVTEAFTRASVAGQFLPCFEPESASAEAVKADRLTFNTAATPPNPNNPARILDQETLPLFTLTVNIELTGQQIVDPTLSAALFAFKRAATLLAQGEDFIVLSGYGRFNGQARGVGVSTIGAGWRDVRPEVNVTGGLPDAWGLIEYGELAVVSQAVLARLAPGAPARRAPPRLRTVAQPVNPITTSSGRWLWPEPKQFGYPRGAAEIVTAAPGTTVIEAVSRAIGRLDELGYPAPYACVLDTQTFEAVEASTPNSLVLPSDRIKAMLGGPLLRSGQMLPNHGVVVSLAGESVDLVVSTAPRAQFLQVNSSGRFLFRVYERFVLRIKEAAPGTNQVRAAAYTFHLR